MKKILIAIFVVSLVASLSYAASPEAVKDQKATEPVGAIVETLGVFIGQVSAATEKSMGGGKEGYVTVVDETGKTKMFPVDPTVKIVDAGFNALTLNQLKKGEKVSVEYSGKSGAEKAKSIKVTK